MPQRFQEWLKAEEKKADVNDTFYRFCAGEIPLTKHEFDCEWCEQLKVIAYLERYMAFILNDPVPNCIGKNK